MLKNINTNLKKEKINKTDLLIATVLAILSVSVTVYAAIDYVEKESNKGFVFLGMVVFFTLIVVVTRGKLKK